MKRIGTIKTEKYLINVSVDSPPKSLMRVESQYLFMTKIHADGTIGDRSIGMGMSEANLLIRMLQEAVKQYDGPSKEYREMR
jgi:hypothetical protein